ncbi:hypothetical protein [Streptomyces sp. NPDC007007]|uniref:hypothetical protein n=1 Tax=Streptomyces sp. NPDC007007 TaxID=3364770 RepID=UPI0036AA9464
MRWLLKGADRDLGKAVAKARTAARAAEMSTTRTTTTDGITGTTTTTLLLTDVQLALARGLAALPLLVLGVFAIRSAVAPAIVGPRHGTAVALVALGLLAAAVGLLIPYVLKWVEDKCGWAKPPDAENCRHVPYYVLAGLFVAFAVACVATIWADVTWNVPAGVGPVAVLAGLLGVVLVALNEMQRWSERATPVAGFRLLKLERTPVFVLLLAWFVVASVMDREGNHEVRVRNEDEANAPHLADAVDLEAAFQSWAVANCATVPASPETQGSPSTSEPVPLVIVAASGGGIRAAYWTASVLDWLFPPGPVTPPAGSSCTPADGRAPVFAVSGVSGGSLGAMSWISRAEADAKDAPTHREVFGQDHLSEVLAWLAFVDLPRAFFGFDVQDRAAVLEKSWERRQEELAEAFYATWQTLPKDTGTPWRPLAILNGSATESGCRVLTSPVRLGAYDLPVGATSCTQRPEALHWRNSAPSEEPGLGGPALIDLRAGFLCESADVNRSTAALLSARFPFITPSGRLTGDRCGHEEAAVSVIDGGYVDATGSLTAIDLHAKLGRLIACHNQRVAGGTGAGTSAGSAGVQNCKPGSGTATRPVRAVLVQIDNGYTSVASAPDPGRPRELLVPLKGKSAAVGSAEASVRQRALEAFGCDGYLTLANVRGPGAQAPLGWVLSRSAQQELDGQLVRLKGTGTETGPGSASPLSTRLATARAKCLSAGL